jgi:8-oxo-dGTP diphosphatase
MTEADPHKLITGAHLILIRDEKVLLGRRYNTGFQDGNYGVPGGHMEANETVFEAAAREAREEIAVMIEGQNTSVVHVIHRKKASGQDRIDFFLTAEHFDGEPKINEPEKCDDLQWFPLDSLPENTVPYMRQGIDAYRRKQFFSEFGW